MADFELPEPKIEIKDGKVIHYPTGKKTKAAPKAEPRPELKPVPKPDVPK